MGYNSSNQERVSLLDSKAVKSRSNSDELIPFQGKSPSEGGHKVLIRPPGEEARGQELRELWNYRYLIPIMARRNITFRYRQSLLGPTWYVLDPIMRMGIFSLVLGGIAQLPSEGIPYPLFVYTALLPWTILSGGVKRGTESLVTHMHIISKVYFPRLILPAAEVLTALVDFAISFVILLGMAFAFGFFPTPRYLLLPLFIVLSAMLALGVGYIFAGLHVRYRDISQFLGYFMKFWEYATPVAYSAAILQDRLPAWLFPVYRLNPMNPVVEGFRWVLVDGGRPPDWTLAVSCIVALVVLGIGVKVFTAAEHSIIDHI